MVDMRHRGHLISNIQYPNSHRLDIPMATIASSRQLIIGHVSSRRSTSNIYVRIILFTIIHHHDNPSSYLYYGDNRIRTYILATINIRTNTNNSSSYRHRQQLANIISIQLIGMSIEWRMGGETNNSYHMAARESPRPFRPQILIIEMSISGWWAID